MRKFFKQIIQIEVLSEDVPLEWDNLRDIDYAIIDGGCSGKVDEISCEPVSAPEMAKLLIGQASDPGFFGLDDDGKDTREAED